MPEYSDSVKAVMKELNYRIEGLGGWREQCCITAMQLLQSGLAEIKAALEAQERWDYVIGKLYDSGCREHEQFIEEWNKSKEPEP